MLGIFPLPNDVLLFFICLGLLICLYMEYFPKNVEPKQKKRIKAFPSRARPVLVPPYYTGAAPRNSAHMDIISLCRFIPKNVVIASVHEESTRNSVKRVIKPTAKPRQPIVASVQESEFSSICKKIIFPYMPGCEPDGPNAVELNTKFTALTRPDVVRFLVARKGNVKLAEEMIVKYLAWRESKFPLKKAELFNAFATRCFFPYGRAKDGTPVVYMRYEHAILVEILIY